MKGPLEGVKVVEFEAIGPAPHAGMSFADMGATVIRIVRSTPVELAIQRDTPYEVVLRNRPALKLNLKSAGGLALARRLIGEADALIESFRPGVMERMGLGPDECHALNPRLVYGRISGWGQDGPLAMSAAHDINYIASVGILNAIGRAGQLPANPLGLVGDFGGGAMYAVQGMLAALLHAGRTGQGQVVDVSIAEAAASLATYYYGAFASGTLSHSRGTNATDSGSHFYNVYECADGKLVSVGAIEGRFYEELVTRMGLDPAVLGAQKDPATWARAKSMMGERFKTRTRDEWCKVLEGTDACFAPVLDWREAAEHPHFVERQSFVELDGVKQPRHAPRFSATPCAVPTAPRDPALTDAKDALGAWLPDADIARLKADGVLG